MKQAILLISTIILFTVSFSCNQSVEKKSTLPASPSSEKILAVYIRKDSVRVIDILLRVIQKTVKYDSLKKKDVIMVDTLFGIPLYLPMKDNIGKDILDSITKKPKINTVPTYVSYPSDSIIWHVENISVDSLLKKQ